MNAPQVVEMLKEKWPNVNFCEYWMENRTVRFEAVVGDADHGEGNPIWALDFTADDGYDDATSRMNVLLAALGANLNVDRNNGESGRAWKEMTGEHCTLL